MLVLSRSQGESLLIRHDGVTWTLTVLARPRGDAVRIRITRKDATESSAGQDTDIELRRDDIAPLGDRITIVIVDVREEKVRFGINAPRDAEIHRRDAWDAIRGQHRSDDDERGEASAAAVPRPKKPSPPSLGRALDEPKPDDEPPKR